MGFGMIAPNFSTAAASQLQASKREKLKPERERDESPASYYERAGVLSPFHIPIVADEPSPSPSFEPGGGSFGGGGASDSWDIGSSGGSSGGEY